MANFSPMIWKLSWTGSLSIASQVSGKSVFHQQCSRLTLPSTASPMHSREMVFEPVDAAAIRDTGEEPLVLRCKKELLEPNSGWYVKKFQNKETQFIPATRVMYSYLKPESIRQHPEATVRPWTTVQVVMGDAISFASALGYTWVTQLLGQWKSDALRLWYKC